VVPPQLPDEPELTDGAKRAKGESRWRCRDIGTRVITAIKLDHEDDLSWYNRPPYAVAEDVFDEGGVMGCAPSVDTGLRPTHSWSLSRPDTAFRLFHSAREKFTRLS
jgi:hypothetical protein